MNNVEKIIGIAASCLAIAAAAGVAHARVGNGSIGRVANPADAGCFSPWLSTMTNNCSGMEELDLPLFVDCPGTEDITVSVLDPYPFGSETYCVSYGLDKDVTWFYSSGNVRANGRGAFFIGGGGLQGALWDLHMATYMPTNGYLYTACFVPRNGRVSTVRWDKP